MAYKLIVSPYAESEIEQIVTYLEFDLDNPQAAGHFLSLLTECYQRIAEMPTIYGLCKNWPAAFQSYRKAKAGNYLVFYKVDEPNERVYIAHVIYGRRDYEKLI